MGNFYDLNEAEAAFNEYLEGQKITARQAAIIADMMIRLSIAAKTTPQDWERAPHHTVSVRVPNVIWDMLVENDKVLGHSDGSQLNHFFSSLVQAAVQNMVLESSLSGQTEKALRFSRAVGQRKQVFDDLEKIIKG